MNDALSFAATKIQPPRPRAARIVRPRLEAALRPALLHARLVLLQAPAGFGKTSSGESGLLSAREAEVLALIAAGNSNKHIARALDVSPHTVKRHVANILDKLAVGSRGQAAAWLRGSGAAAR